MRELPGFWVVCRSPEVPSDPLTVSVPGLGEALVVFCFEEEALLYLGYEDGDLRPCPVRSNELMVLLLGAWSRFELVTLDPMPHNDAGFMLRLASMHRDDFLDHLVCKHGLWPRAHADDLRTQREGGSDVEYTSSDPGLVSGPPAPD
jgi:hypothetical protein